MSYEDLRFPLLEVVLGTPVYEKLKEVFFEAVKTIDHRVSRYNTTLKAYYELRNPYDTYTFMDTPEAINALNEFMDKEKLHRSILQETGNDLYYYTAGFAAAFPKQLQESLKEFAEITAELRYRFNYPDQDS